MVFNLLLKLALTHCFLQRRGFLQKLIISQLSLNLPLLGSSLVIDPEQVFTELLLWCHYHARVKNRIHALTIWEPYGRSSPRMLICLLLVYLWRLVESQLAEAHLLIIDGGEWLVLEGLMMLCKLFLSHLRKLLIWVHLWEQLLAGVD